MICSNHHHPRLSFSFREKTNRHQYSLSNLLFSPEVQPRLILGWCGPAAPLFFGRRVYHHQELFKESLPPSPPSTDDDDLLGFRWPQFAPPSLRSNDRTWVTEDRHLLGRDLAGVAYSYSWWLNQPKIGSSNWIIFQNSGMNILKHIWVATT